VINVAIRRDRKSKFVRLFDKTPPDVFCPHFYELVLSNGCPYNCSYCYLKLTFRGKTEPVLFQNGWEKVKAELDATGNGVFSTGELADSLAITPPLLPKAMEYFAIQDNKLLLLVTKSTNIEILRSCKPSPSLLVSFSINSISGAAMYETNAPHPHKRLEAAKELINLGWRVRIRIDPIMLECGLESYKPICKEIAAMNPERVTVGTLRQYPGLFRFLPHAPRKGLSKAQDGRMRYSISDRIDTYKQISEWLGSQPSLCKETNEVWNTLGWQFTGCNCTP
jgi:spore photoproduct lyase